MSYSRLLLNCVLVILWVGAQVYAQQHRDHAIVRISESAANQVATEHVRSLNLTGIALVGLRLQESTSELEYKIDNFTLTSVDGLRPSLQLQDRDVLRLLVKIDQLVVTGHLTALLLRLISVDREIPFEIVNGTISAEIAFITVNDQPTVSIANCVFGFEVIRVHRGFPMDKTIRDTINHILNLMKEKIVGNRDTCLAMTGFLTPLLTGLLSNQGDFLSSISTVTKTPVNIGSAHVHNQTMLLVFQVDSGGYQYSPELVFTSNKDFQISLGENFLNKIIDALIHDTIVDKNSKLQMMVQTVLKKETLQIIIPQLQKTMPDIETLHLENTMAKAFIRMLPESARVYANFSMELWADMDKSPKLLFRITSNLELGLVVEFSSSSLKFQLKGFRGVFLVTESNIGDIKNNVLDALLNNMAAHPDAILGSLNDEMPAISLASVLPRKLAFKMESAMFKEGHMYYEANVGPRDVSDYGVQYIGTALEPSSLTLREGPSSMSSTYNNGASTPMDNAYLCLLIGLVAVLTTRLSVLH